MMMIMPLRTYIYICIEVNAEDSENRYKNGVVADDAETGRNARA
jgi:hypothetical protein